LRGLQLKLESCDNIDDDSMITLVQSLPSALQFLQVSFEHCGKISDVGVALLAQGLPIPLRELRLNFRACSQLTDEGVSALARCLPAPLESLSVSFENCGQVGDAGLACFGQGLPARLHRLELELCSCSRITSRGIASLSSAMETAAELRQVSLGLRLCRRVGDAGISALVGSLPTGVSSVALDLALTGVGRNVACLLGKFQEALHLGTTEQADLLLGQILEAAGPPAAGALPADALEVCGRKARILVITPIDWIFGENRQRLLALKCVPEVDDLDILDVTWSVSKRLQRLRLDAVRCPHIGHRGIAALLEKLPSCLQILEVNLSCSQGIGDASLAILASAPGNLQTLHLDFSGCDSVTDAGVAALAKGLPGHLQILNLDFHCCSQVGNQGVAALACCLPASLQVLLLNLHFCKSVGTPGIAALARKLPDGLEALGLNVKLTSVSSANATFCSSLEMLRQNFPREVLVAQPALPWQPGLEEVVEPWQLDDLVPQQESEADDDLVAGSDVIAGSVPEWFSEDDEHLYVEDEGDSDEENLDPGLAGKAAVTHGLV
jgi:hypothetical protein